MKKLLIINKHSFGFPISSYKWCQYLKDEYSISCLNYGKYDYDELIEGIIIKRVSTSGPYILRGFRFLIHAILKILFFNGVVVVIYFPKCHFLKRIYPHRKMILDIRTLSINPNPQKRKQEDVLIKKAANLYDEVIVISEGMKSKIGLQKIHVVPLGSDCISSLHKDYSNIKLLYVGTFNGRKIETTIKGLNLFLSRNKKLNITYDIVGYGLKNEENELKHLVDTLCLNDIVTFHGKVDHSKLKSFFDKCCIGVSFVPITPFYDSQPVTKTYEYINSGLYTIATATNENKKIITDVNGFLIEDTVESFANALDHIYLNSNSFNEIAIRDSLKDYTWENIVKLQLKPILDLY